MNARPARDGSRDHCVPVRLPEREASTQGEDSPTALALEYLGVADALARRFRRTGHDADDLRQVARLGLLKAAQRYQEPLGHGFVQYAVPTILGELKRYMRDQSWVVRPPRALQELRLKVNALRPVLVQELGHEPSTAELSAAAGIPEVDVARAELAAAAMVGDPVGHGDASEEPWGGQLILLSSEELGYERAEQREDLERALADATNGERRILYLRFVEELTQEQIASDIGVSQMQVSRLLRRLLDRLRRRMAA